MITKLFKHQEVGKLFLKNKTRACLFWEVGTGKTNTVISAVNDLPRGKLLILAPKCVISGMWEKYDDLPINHDYEFVSYEYVSRHAKEYSTKYYDYIICDECHKLKSVKSKIGKVVRTLARKSVSYVWGLTGTPYATSFLDVYGIFLNLGIREFENTYETFMHEYYNCDIIYVNSGRYIYRPASLKTGMLDVLIKRIGKHASVLRSEDCLDLPGLTVKEIEIEGMRTQEYIDGLKGIVTYADEHKETVNKLACVQKLHQMSNGFVYDASHTAYPFKVNSKLETCANLVEMELEERSKLIIVYLYQYDCDCLSALLSNMKISYTTNFDDFSSAQVLLLQEQRAIGVNLQAFTNCMIFYTYSYAYLEYNQAVGRIYRTGQKEPCTVYALINKGTAERKIWTAVQKAYNMDTTFKSLMVQMEDNYD